jgi:hypothetical protein
MSGVIKVISSLGVLNVDPGKTACNCLPKNRNEMETFPRTYCGLMSVKFM